MNQKLIPLFGGLLILFGVALAADDGAGGENAAEEEKKDPPPNEWGTYYTLPAELPVMSDLFIRVFTNYVNGRDPETKCRENDADFERWYESSKNEDHVILSYYCRTKDARGYEHMKVSKKNGNVVEFQTSLKGFGIMNAGDYENELPEAEGKALKAQLLGNVTKQIALQKGDTRDQDELCPNPGTDTIYSVQTKNENGLYYYKLAISCNVTHIPGYASHMTHIEVVVDKDFGVVNDGLPELAVLDIPTRNSQFIRDRNALKELAALKQSSGFQMMFPGVATIILAPAMRLLF